MREGPACRVLISYAHQTPEEDAQVLRLYELLRENSVDARIDTVAAEQPQDWALWTEREIRHADHVLMIVSAAYREGFERTARTGAGLGVGWEAGLIRDALYTDHEAGGLKFLPVLLPGAEIAQIPGAMRPRSTTHYRVTDFTVGGAERLIRFLTRQPAHVAPTLGPVPDLPPLRHAPRVVLCLRVDGGSPELRHAVARTATDAATGHADTATIESDENGETRGAVVVMAPGTHPDLVGSVIRTVHETVGSAVRSVPDLQVRIGADIDRAGRPAVGQAAGRLARCAARRAVHDLSAAHVVVVVSPEFYSRIVDAPGAFPHARAYAARSDSGVDDGECWVAVAGRSVCPPSPPPRAPVRRASPHSAEIDEAPRSDHRFSLPHNSGTVSFVNQRDHGVVNITRGGDGGRRP